MTTLTHRPTLLTSGIAGLAALTAVVGAGLGSVSGFGLSAVGLVVLALGLGISRRIGVDLGGAVLFLGVVVSGIGSQGVEVTVAATIATVVAWDLGHTAIDLGEQLGREPDTARLEGVRAFWSLFVGLLAATLGYGVYLFAIDGQPVASVVLLLLAACFVVFSLGSRRRRLHTSTRATQRN